VLRVLRVLKVVKVGEGLKVMTSRNAMGGAPLGTALGGALGHALAIALDDGMRWER
jgi:hypothetical protein